MTNSHTFVTTANGFVRTSETIQEQDDTFEPVPSIDFSSMPVTFCHELESQLTSLSSQVTVSGSQTEQSTSSSIASSSPESRNQNEYETGDSQILVTASEGEISFGVERTIVTTGYENTFLNEHQVTCEQLESSSEDEKNLWPQIICQQKKDDLIDTHGSNHEGEFEKVQKAGSSSDDSSPSSFLESIKEPTSSDVSLVSEQDSSDGQDKMPIEQLNIQIGEHTINTETQKISNEKCSETFALNKSKNKSDLKNLHESNEEFASERTSCNPETNVWQISESGTEEVSSMVNHIVLDVISCAVHEIPTNNEFIKEPISIQNESRPESEKEEKQSINQKDKSNSSTDDFEGDFVQVRLSDILKVNQKNENEPVLTRSNESAFKTLSSEINCPKDETQLKIEPINLENNLKHQIRMNNDESVTFKNIDQNKSEDQIKSISEQSSDFVQETQTLDDNEGKTTAEKNRENNNEKKTLKTGQSEPAVDCFSCSIL